RIEPGVSLSSWTYDRISNNWERIAAAFVAGGGMTYLSQITDWVSVWGPAGVGFVGLVSALSVWVALALASSLRAKAKLRMANTEVIQKWKDQVTSANPLAPEFHRERLRIDDVAHPISKSITGKRFIDCELIGPANLFMSRVNLSHVGFIDCDVVVARERSIIRNATLIDNVQMVGGQIWNCTFIIPPNLVETFASMGGKFVTLTGVSKIDNQPPLDTAEEKRP
ncbi:hypothetical protein, partial [Rhodopseudomonas palustris]|uniref:hypothetical protein n=2 Tax=Rhodopseudomonas TaxID=1073 RepID=UPI000ADE556B